MLRLHVAHTSEGRLRLRTAGSHPVEERLFAELRQALGQHHAVREIRTNARTGSVLLLHEGKVETLLEQLKKLETIELIPQGVRSPMLRLHAALQETEARIAQRTRGKLTLGSLTFVAMAAAGAFQTGRGRLLPAGMTLLEYAYSAMMREAERERAESQKAKP